MNIVIANEKTHEIVSEHLDLNSAKEAYLPYFRECCKNKSGTENWIFQNKDGKLENFPRKEEMELRNYFLNS